MKSLPHSKPSHGCSLLSGYFAGLEGPSRSGPCWAFQLRLFPLLPLLLPTMNAVFQLLWTSWSSMDVPYSFTHESLDMCSWMSLHEGDHQTSAGVGRGGVERIWGGAGRWPTLGPPSKRWEAPWRQRLQVILLVSLCPIPQGQPWAYGANYGLNWIELNWIIFSEIFSSLLGYLGRGLLLNQIESQSTIVALTIHLFI